MPEPTAGSPTDDPNISDSDSLYRRIANSGPGSLVAVDEGTGERRPSSGAFKSDEDGLSTYVRSVLTANGLRPEDLVRAPQNAVVEFAVSLPRSLALGVIGDPWPTGTDDDAHPRNVAHTLIIGMQGLSKSAARKAAAYIARSSKWIIDPAARS